VLAIAVATVVAVAGAGRPARAADIDDKQKEARRLYLEGQRLFDATSYAEAIERFKAADALAPAPILSYDIGQAYRHLGDCPTALAYFRLYVRRDPEARSKIEVRMALADMEKCALPDLAPRLPLPPPPPQPDLTAGRGKRIGGAVTAGLGAALVAVGVVLAVRASDAASQIDGVARMHGAWSPELADVQSGGKRDALLSAIALGAGGAALATGGVLFVVGLREKDHALSGLSMAATWRF
jgi:tetratricopeptide (TPR) repeat protein